MFNDDDTSLIIASGFGYSNIVKLLIDNGANIEVNDNDSNTKCCAFTINSCY